MTPISLEGQVALVTGASRGIGHAVALELAKAGAHIIAVARTRSQGALEALDDKINELGSTCTMAPLDIRDGDAIDRLGGALYERFSKLDILVGNAGTLGPITPISHIEPKDWAELIETNLTANYRLIRSMDPLLKQSKAGRAVFVSSGAAGKNKAYWGGYAATKAALEELVLTYCNELKITDIKCNIVDPGPIRTKMRARAVPGEDPANLPTPDQIAPLFLELCAPDLEKHGEIIKFYDWAGIKR